jgi:hypothetical protein
MTRKDRMKWRLSMCLTAVGSLSIAAALPAQTIDRPGMPGLAESSLAETARAERVREIEHDKGTFVNELLVKWAEAATARGYDAYWQKGQRNLLGLSSAELLTLSERATDFDTFDKLVFRGFTTEVLGDLTQDLVFFPVAPCRLLDTRVPTNTAPYQGPKPPGTQVAFSVNDTLAPQGGLAAGCGIPGVDPPALSVVVTAAPTDTGQGNLRAYPTGGTPPFASIVNYQGGVVVAGGTIAQICTGCGDELTVRNQGAGTTHIIVDVTGYFARPNATALDCMTLAGGSLSIPAGGTGATSAPACATGYTATGLYCESTNWNMPIVWQSGAFCQAKNLGGATATLKASQRCCRVPGQSPVPEPVRP